MISAGAPGMPASTAQATPASGFGPPTVWSPHHIPGGDGAFVAADIDFDHDADVVGCANNGVWVMQSLVTFLTPAQWQTEPFHGSHATLAGDVDADGDADLIAVNANDIRVMLAD